MFPEIGSMEDERMGMGTINCVLSEQAQLEPDHGNRLLEVYDSSLVDRHIFGS